jgi:hypothetical protein
MHGSDDVEMQDDVIVPVVLSIHLHNEAARMAQTCELKKYLREHATGMLTSDLREFHESRLDSVLAANVMIAGDEVPDKGLGENQPSRPCIAQYKEKMPTPLDVSISRRDTWIQRAMHRSQADQ